MGPWIILALSLLRAEATLVDGGAVACVVPEGAVVAEVSWAGRVVRAREGALEIDGRRITPCEGLPGPFPTTLAVDEDALWIGFRAAGVHRFDGARFHGLRGLPTDGVRALAVQGDALWIGLGVEGLWRSDGERATRFRHRILGRKGVTALIAHGESLQVGVGPYGVWSVEGRAARRVQRGVFAGCFRGGQPVAPGAGCDFGEAQAASGLPSGHITALAEHAGRLYVGTFDQGLARQEGARFLPVPGAPRFVNALLSDRGTLWIATPRGLFTLGPDHVVRRAPVALPSDHVNALATGDGVIWVATSRGLAGLGARGVEIWDRRRGLPGRIVYAVAVAGDGALWAGTDAGAARIAAGEITVFDHTRGSLTHDWVNALLPDGDAMLAGTYDAGVVRLTPDGRGAVVPGLEDLWVNPAGLTRVAGQLVVATLGDGLRTARGRRQGLPSQDVTAARLHDGALWIGTRGGLVRVGGLPQS